MKTNIYALFIALLLSSLLQVQAQDSTVVDTVGVPPSGCPINIGVLHDSLSSPGRYRFYAIPGGDTVRWYINNAYIRRGDTLTGYFVPGTYTVCAYRHTTDGCTSSTCMTLYVADSTRTDTTRNDTTQIPACPLSIGEIIDSMHTPVEYGFYAAPAGDTVRWYINNSYMGMGDSLLNRTFSPGNYVICAYRHTPDSCVNSACISLYVADTTRADTTRTDSTLTDTAHLPPPPPPVDSLRRNDQISTYPNPAPGESNIDLQLEGNSTIQIQVFNSMGHLMLSRKVAGVSGLNHITLPVAGLPKGIYYVQVEYGNVKKRSRIQKL